ncbi:hypothetical protein LXL04_021735 [Taraxacum kok-saghyz]
MHQIRIHKHIYLNWPMDKITTIAIPIALEGIFRVGDEVEINGFRSDRRLCFYVGTINFLFQTYADVLFRDLEADDGKALLDRVRIEFLHPKPGVFVYDYKCGDAVEIWEKDRWCKGKFLEVTTVYFVVDVMFDLLKNGV